MLKMDSLGLVGFAAPRFIALLTMSFALLAGCAHRQTVEDRTAAATTTVRNRIPSDLEEKPRFRKFDLSHDTDFMEFSAVIDARPVALQLEMSSRCPFGIPVMRSDLEFGPTELVNRRGYQLLHSGDLKTPYWVCETYTEGSLKKKFERGSLKFGVDPKLSGARAVPADYAGSSEFKIRGRSFPIDIGHMAPAEAHSSSERRLLDTFYLSNAVPQHRAMNRGQWARLEACARNSLPSNGTAWVISGPMNYTEEDVTEFDAFVIGDEVVIPTHTWKIFISESEDGDRQAWAAVMPNQELPSGSTLNDFAASIDDIESATGFDFLPDLSRSEQDVLERGVNEIPCS